MMSPRVGKQVQLLPEFGLGSALAVVAPAHARQRADPMLPELGTLLLVLALLVALVQAVVPLAGAQRGRSSWMAVARPAALVQLALIASAFAVLTHAFLVQDFRCATSPRIPTACCR